METFTIVQSFDLHVNTAAVFLRLSSLPMFVLYKEYT